MNDWLLIRNSGLAPLESFTILGLSTARGEGDKIGQFGSGSKHGILALLRADIHPRIFIGESELIFSLHDATIPGKDYKEVRYSINGETHKTGMCLEFGALDWDSPTMAIREFICNALDQGEDIKECVFRARSVSSDEEETRIYVPMEKEVREYFENMGRYFLHFDEQQEEKIIPARKPDAVMLYRRGVFVREMVASSPPLFDYNFRDQKIDESRNLNDGAVSSIAAKLLIECPDRLKEVLRSFEGSPKWEHQIGHCFDYWDENAKRVIGAAWKSVYGELPFSCSEECSLALAKKNISYVRVASFWESVLKRAGIVHGSDLLMDMESDGGEVCEATPEATETFKRAWGWIERAKLTSGKPYPKVKCFTIPMSNGGERIGYYSNGTVFLNLDHDGNEQAAIEELAHYITGAADETRDFQDFAFKLAKRIAKEAFK